MQAPRESDDPPAIGLDAFQRPAESQGLSLDQLSEAFAEMLGRGHDPYEEHAAHDDAPPPAETVLGRGEADQRADAACELSPRAIVEAVLFVGAPNNEPVSPARLASLMRGVRSDEIDAWVAELKAEYEANACAFTIESCGEGYRMSLRDEHRRIREKLAMRSRHATLSQAAVEVLSLIAYRPGLARDEVSELRGSASGAILAQLVRRELLCLKRDDAARPARYYTTQRFLDLVGLSNLDELPHSEDVERR